MKSYLKRRIKSALGNQGPWCEFATSSSIKFSLGSKWENGNRSRGRVQPLGNCRPWVLRPRGFRYSVLYPTMAARVSNYLQNECTKYGLI